MAHLFDEEDLEEEDPRNCLNNNGNNGNNGNKHRLSKAMAMAAAYQVQRSADLDATYDSDSFFRTRLCFNNTGTNNSPESSEAVSTPELTTAPATGQSAKQVTEATPLKVVQ